MENLFKIEKIDGKGLGWIALRDIEAGTLIFKEKDKNFPRPPGYWEYPPHFEANLMGAFFAMSKNDQKEFLERSNTFLDLNSVSNVRKKWFFNLKQHIQRQNRSDGDFLLKIICIHVSNGILFDGLFGIKSAKINHSCCSNSFVCVNEMTSEIEIRATSKIRYIF